MTDKPTPKDAELKAMWQLHAADIGGIFGFAHAVLAKWGQSAQARADSVPAVADAMADSQYLAGVSAGWNAANADDPNAALQKLHESRAGYLKPLDSDWPGYHTHWTPAPPAPTSAEGVEHG